MTSKSSVVYSRDLEAITKPLRIGLIWPKTNTPEDVTVVFFLKFVITFVALSFPTTFALIFHLWKDLQDFNLSMLIDIQVILECICVFGMCFIYFYNLKIIVLNVNHTVLEQYETFNYSKLIKGIYLLVIINISILAAYKYITKSNCLKRASYSTSTTVCGHIIPKELPFNIDSSPIYELLLVHEVAMLTIMFCLFLNGIVLMMYFVEKRYTKLKGIQSSLKCINKSDLSDHDAVRTALINVAKDHNAVISGVKELNKICKYINLIHFVMGSMILAVALLDVLISHNVESLLHFLGWFVSILVITSGCQILINEGNNVAKEIYKIKWYTMNPENQRFVLFMLMAAQRPLGVDAGPFKTLCLPTFLTVSKATYSYLNLLINSL